MFRSTIEFQLCHQTVDLLSNPYLVHRRIYEACSGDPRLLFYIGVLRHRPSIVVQSHVEPIWEYAFGDMKQADAKWRVETFEPVIRANTRYHFRLLANPTYKRGGRRWGIRNEREQVQWLIRKLHDAGANLIACSVERAELIRSYKNKDATQVQQHWAVWFVGKLLAMDAGMLRYAVENGVGPAKGFGFGLLLLQFRG